MYRQHLHLAPWAACAVAVPFLSLAGWAQQPVSAEPAAVRIEGLNQALAAAVSSGAPADQLRGLLTQRAALFLELLAVAPAKAGGLVLSPELAMRIKGIVPDSAMESQGEWKGVSEALVADDFQNRRSTTTWYLRTADERLQLFFADKPPRKPGTQIRIKGVRMGTRVAVQAVLSETASSQKPNTPLGPQNIAVLLVTMPSQPTLPAGADFFQQGFFGPPTGSVATETLNAYWLQTSYGQTSAVGQIFGPFALASDYACGGPSGTDQSSDLAKAALAAAQPTVDFTKFTHTAIIFPTVGCSYGGLSTVGGDPSTSWLPVSPTQAPGPNYFYGLSAHELGHGLGLNHSNSEDFGTVPLGALDQPGVNTEYGDLFAAMGDAYRGGQYVAEHKSLVLGWLRPGGYLEVTAPGTFMVQPLESTGDPRALRILRDPVSSAWLWVEYRLPLTDLESAVSASLPGTNGFSGALIHYENPELDSLHSYLLDFNPVSSPNDFSNPAMLPGTSWSDPYSPLTLTVNSANSNGLSVSVAYDPPCATLGPAANSFPAAAGSGSIAVSAPSTCNWTAITRSSWISFDGPVAGRGNGSVSFTVAANTDTAQRTGDITIQRQSTALVQDGATGLSVLSMSPTTGSGSTAQLTFAVRDSKGYADINRVSISFEAPVPVGGSCQQGCSPGCQMFADPIHQLLYLLNDAGSQFTGTGLKPPGNNLSGSGCTLFPAGSSITGSGDNLVVSLQVSFSSGFGGNHRVLASATGTAGSTSTNQIPVGTWVVPVTISPSVTIHASAPGAPFSLDDGAVYRAPATFYWAPGDQHKITWLSSTAGASGTYAFVSWADGANNPRTITMSSASSTYQANIAVSGLGYFVQTLAGGSIPGAAAQAASVTIPTPSGVATDKAGNLFFSSATGSVVYKVAKNGALSRVAGNGVAGYAGDGGPALNARLNNPQGLAVDGAGNLYIADTNNARIRKVTPSGSIATVAGNGGYGSSGDGGAAISAQLLYPGGVAVDASGEIYIADSSNQRIRKVTADGTINTLAGNGQAGYSGDGGNAAAAQLNDPFGVAVDGFRNVYIADRNNQRVRKVDANGVISTVAGTGSGGPAGDGGQAVAAQLNAPQGVAVDGAGNLYVADEYNYRIRKVANGIITTVAGTGASSYSGDGGPAATGQLTLPFAVAADSAGDIYVADYTNQRIRRISGGIISTVAGGGIGDGAIGPFAGFNQPYGVAKDPSGNVYVADTLDHRVRKIAPGGVVSTVAGTGIAGFSGDNGPASSAVLNSPQWVMVDKTGNLYISDTGNNRIREVDSTGVIRTVAGSGKCCTLGDNGSALNAWLSTPWETALDASGNLYIADSTNNRIRKVANGTITTLAGNGTYGYSGDGGPATAATFRTPRGVAVDAPGNVYVADSFNYRIRKIAGDSTITTLTGDGTYGYAGDGGPAAAARIGDPYAVAVDASGNLYFADAGQDRIRQIAGGVISTIAGSGSYSYSGDGGPASDAAFRSPSGLAIDSAGNILVADASNGAIRLLTLGSSPVLSVMSNHGGAFESGKNGLYSVLVSNAFLAPFTNGPVTVTENPGPGMSIVSMTGPGWNCGSGNSCSRSDALSSGTYPPITVTVNVRSDAPSQTANSVTVSGGGAAIAGAEDLTEIVLQPRKLRPPARR